MCLKSIKNYDIIIIKIKFTKKNSADNNGYQTIISILK